MRLPQVIRENTGFQLMILFGCFFVGMIVLMIITSVSAAVIKQETHLSMMLLMVCQAVLIFCVPAWLTARFCSNMPSQWLELNTIPSIKSLLGVIILYILALPAMNQIILWNAGVHFPEWAAGMEQSLRDMELAAEEATKKAMAYHGIGGLLLTVAVVGLVTGFSEELFFRGGLQGIIERTRIGKQGSVWLVAVIFSTVHFQFFGFIPRLLMGAMFGYLLLWTRSLWVPIFAHALNNSVVVLSLPKDGSDNAVVNSLGTSEEGIPWYALASVVATAIFLYRFRYYFFKRNINSDR